MKPLKVGMMSGGAWDGQACIGRSLAVGLKGQILAHLPFGVSAETFRAEDVETAAKPISQTAK